MKGKHVNKKLMNSIREMMDSPNANEADTARRVYQRLLDKHGIEATPEGEEPEYKWAFPFKYQNKRERRLIFQCIYKAIGTLETRTTRYHQEGRKRSMVFKLTNEECDYAHVLYAIYRKALATEIERLYLAFLQKHRIFGKNDGEPEPIDEKELDEMRRMMYGLSHIDAIHRDTKRLGGDKLQLTDGN